MNIQERILEDSNPLIRNRLFAIQKFCPNQEPIFNIAAKRYYEIQEKTGFTSQGEIEFSNEFLHFLERTDSHAQVSVEELVKDSKELIIRIFN